MRKLLSTLISVFAFAALSGAMEQQLGLRLQKTKASVDVIVIDKIEKPSAN